MSQNQMEVDWNRRAREDARKWITVGEDHAAFESGGVADCQTLVSSLDGCVDREARVLEIGCGIGRLMKYMAPYFQEVHGVDVSEEMVQQGRERLQAIPNVFFHKGNGQDLGVFPNNSFALVYSYIVLQHIPRRWVYRYFPEVTRTLKPGGYFLFQLYRPETIRHWVKYWLGVEKPDRDTVGIRRYSRSEITRLVRGASLELCWIKSVDRDVYFILARKSVVS